MRSAIAVLMTVLMIFQTPARVLADEADPDYISEVRIGMGKDAENYLTSEGFAILKDGDGNAIDLNKDAGGGWGSGGDVKVIMGYKTTKDQSEAITDLAVMNMYGGYDVQEYEALMETRMDSQVIPLVQKLQSTIDEYRANYRSSDPVNKKRAEYMHDALNKFTDDDCGGAGLGDLLLNKTKFEMGDAAYDKLTEAEKKDHCDITTLFMQADGQLMLLIYDLLTRAADTAEDSWIDRFSAMTYEDLIDSYDMTPTDAKKQVTKDYDNGARILLDNWDTFRELLLEANDSVEALNEMEEPDADAAVAKTKKIQKDSGTDEVLEALSDVVDVQIRQARMIELASAITVADYLESIDYGDGTMFDFFTQNKSTMEKNIQDLYPLVASLSEGQRAGLEFISFQELVMVSNRETEYSKDDLKDIAVTSVYDGVDRGIYQKGGVALTWEAKRSEVMETEKNAADRRLFSTKTIVLWALTGISAAAFIGSLVNLGVKASRYVKASLKLRSLNKQLDTIYKDCFDSIDNGNFMDDILDMNKSIDNGTNATEIENKLIPEQKDLLVKLAAPTKTAAWMAAGFAVAMVIIAGITTYMTWRDMKAYYDVDYAVIPHYMVDETDITYYNANNEKMVKENHAAYYKAVSCNRSEKADTYKAMTDCADLNGDVGQQWLALYACRNNKVMQPILADSLKVVTGSTELPAGYETGIHMFGQDSAFNLNNTNYDWNQSAPKIFVYFQIDTEAPVSTSASAFSGGWIALAAVVGMGIGAVAAAVIMTSIKKKKEGTSAA